MKLISVTKNGKITGGSRERTCTSGRYGRSVKRCVDTIRYMLPENINPEQSCLISTLISAAIGFIVGFVSRPSDRAARLSTVMAARYAANYGSNSTVSKLPRVPRVAFFFLCWPPRLHLSGALVRFFPAALFLLSRLPFPEFRVVRGCWQRWHYRARQMRKGKATSKTSFPLCQAKKLSPVLTLRNLPLG
jgi:hypothetical protein